MKISVIAVDPGVTTGITRFRFNKGDMVGRSVPDAIRAGTMEQFETTVHADKFMHWQEEMAWANDTAAGILKWWQGQGELHIIFEDFLLRREGTAQRHTLSPVRLTAYLISAIMYQTAASAIALTERAGALPPGRARTLARRRARSLSDRIYITAQTPAQAKGFATDARLKGWDLWIPGQRHARDSLRHLALWLQGYPGR